MDLRIYANNAVERKLDKQAVLNEAATIEYIC